MGIRYAHTFTALDVFCSIAFTRETDLVPALTTDLLMLLC